MVDFGPREQIHISQENVFRTSALPPTFFVDGLSRPDFQPASSSTGQHVLAMATNQSGHATEIHPHSYLSEAPLYRVTTLFRARPDLTEAEFYHHWYNQHGPMCAPWALHWGFVEYTQYQTSSELRQALAGGKDGGFKAGSPFEACADFYVKDYNDYLAAFQDPYYLEVIKPDEDTFVDKGQVDGSSTKELGKLKAISTMGLCKSIIRDGQAVVSIPEEVQATWERYQQQKEKRASR